MNDLYKIADKIEQHVIIERKLNAANRAIGGGKILLNNKETYIWILNREIESTTIIKRDIRGEFKGTTCGGVEIINDGGISTSKNTYWGRSLLENFSGTFNYTGRDKKKINYEICNSYTYDAHPNDIKNIRLGSPDLGAFVIFKLIKDLRNQFASLNEKVEEERVAREKAEELKREEQRINEEFEKDLKRVCDEQEAKLLAIEHKKGAERHQKEIRKEQKRIRLLEEERLEMERSLKFANEQYKYAVSFIRTQACLRNNPILDKEQNKIKFSHLFDGTTIIIDGGPGTGKTTTLIQRLKFLISRYDLEDFQLNSNNLKISEQEMDILSDERSNWVFFSPTDLLCKYLRSNMEYEGLINPGDKTKVWHTHLRTILRDYYHLAGTDLPFEFKTKDLSGNNLLRKGSLQVTKSFTKFYLTTLKSKLKAISEIECDSFSWKMLGKMITSTCSKVNEVKTIEEMMRLLYQLDELKKITIPGTEQTIASIIESYNKKIKDISIVFMVRISKEKKLYDSLLKLVASWETPEDNEEDLVSDIEEEENSEEISNKREIKLNQYVRSLLKSLSLKTIDNKVKIQGRKLELYKLLEPYIEIDNLKSLGSDGYFVQNVYPSFLRNYETFLFSSISQIYKNFRKDVLRTRNVEWEKKMLNMIITKHKNKSLHPQEQALLLGFINNLVMLIRKTSIPRFNSLKHKYAVAYKECCRPIIGVDEATDYTLYDYYGIASLRHYLISSITLTGDLMQCLNENGLTDWSKVQSPLIFPKIEVNELKISYRQSPELIKLADYLYSKAMQKPSPYSCNLIEQDIIPKPLWFYSEEEEDKIEWIIDRIIEVKKAYGLVPSIAIFATDKQEISSLKESMDDSNKLDTAGIEVIDCSNGLTDASKDTIRIFPLEMVKGMEFEVVFFHNIHKINSVHLFDRYLYVGLSRASFYMGVTSNDELIEAIAEVSKLFESTGNWNINE